MAADFDAEALHRLVDGALDPAPAPRQRLIIGPTDTRLFEAFGAALADRLPPGEVQMVFDEARDVLAQGLDLDIDHLRIQINLCKACPERSSSPTTGRWNLTDPDLLLVAESPNIGPEVAELLVNALTEAGFSSRRVGLTYATRCRNGSAQTCSGFLEAELTLLCPKIIVPLGAEVSQYFIGDAKITEVHGQLFWLGPWAVLPCTNPLYAIRSGTAEVLVSDLRKAHRFVYGTGAVERGAPEVPQGVEQPQPSSSKAQSGHAGAL